LQLLAAAFSRWLPVDTIRCVFVGSWAKAQLL
jgi:hypothetical protein